MDMDGGNMSTDLFLSELREAMEGSVSPSFVNENVRYYEEYIATEVRKGRSEEDIMEELGDPRLIARTLIDTAERGVRRGAGAVYEEAEPEEEQGDGVYRDSNMRITKVSGGKALLVIVCILLIFIVVFVGALVLIGSFIAAFWPALLAAAVIWWILNPNKYE